MVSLALSTFGNVADETMARAAVPAIEKLMQSDKYNIRKKVSVFISVKNNFFLRRHYCAPREL